MNRVAQGIEMGLVGYEAVVIQTNKYYSSNHRRRHHRNTILTGLGDSPRFVLHQINDVALH